MKTTTGNENLKYYVDHYYNNPRNNYRVFCETKKDAIIESKYISTDDLDSSESSQLCVTKTGDILATHLWCEKNLRWN